MNVQPTAAGFAFEGTSEDGGLDTLAQQLAQAAAGSGAQHQPNADAEAAALMVGTPPLLCLGHKSL